MPKETSVAAETIKRIEVLAELLETLKGKGWTQEKITEAIDLLAKLGKEK